MQEKEVSGEVSPSDWSMVTLTALLDTQVQIYMAVQYSGLTFWHVWAEDIDSDIIMRLVDIAKGVSALQKKRTKDFALEVGQGIGFQH